jgi:hypothetical protein
VRALQEKEGLRLAVSHGDTRRTKS